MSAGRQASILLVDDRPHNLVALEAILEPLGHELVKAGSGERALRELLLRDFAVILLDVQMPGLDGFATADLIKGRERTKHVPIIFLTAISKENAHVDRGYSAGAVDYLFKPFDPTVLRSKVSVFIDLWEKKEQLREQEARLREQEIAALTRESEERYRTLTEALPQLVWRARADGYFEYLNERWIAYTGEPPEASFGHEWAQFLHPDDRARSVSVWENGLEAGTPIELEFRLRGGDGVHRWQLARAVPIRDAQGTIAGWVGACTDIDSQKKAEAAQRFLLEAGALLGSSLDYRKTLADVAQAAVPSFADWCAVHVLEQDGSLQQLAVAHADERKVQFARELQERYPTDPDSATGPPNVVRTGRSELVPEIPDELLESAARDELHLGLIREIGLRSYMCVPLVVRERTFGAITFVQAESGSSYDEDDLALAEELARRAATAVDNAQLYRQSEERGRAARVLATVGDGVFLLDADGVIRLWNPAAELLTGLAEADVLGRAALEVIPGWAEFEPRIPV
ncbi:MAG: PAS domain S-box protein, partial [Gaiellaceae bacterium]